MNISGYQICVVLTWVFLYFPTLGTRCLFHERVRKVVPVKLKEKTRYTVNQQYPTEIINRRQNLYPKMKELQRRGMRASLVYDQIFVNGRPYDETRVERPNPANARHS